MTEYSKRGLRAASRQRSKGKLPTLAGNMRASKSLGANDPRAHRNPQGDTLTHRQFDADDFTVDKNGRIKTKD